MATTYKFAETTSPIIPAEKQRVIIATEQMEQTERFTLAQREAELGRQQERTLKLQAEIEEIKTALKIQ